MHDDLYPLHRRHKRSLILQIGDNRFRLARNRIFIQQTQVITPPERRDQRLPNIAARTGNQYI